MLSVLAVVAAVACGYFPPATQQPVVTPNDPLYPEQWALPAVSMPAAWSVLTGSRSVAVAVIDSGVDSVPDLRANLGQGVRCAPTCREPVGLDASGHGTAVASVLGSVGNNGRELSGVAWNVTLLPVQVDSPTTGTSVAGIANGINWAVQRGARIVNMSLVNRGEQPAIEAAIMRAPATLFVVPAGNDGRDLDGQHLPVYPCIDPAPNVVCVAATDRSGRLTSTSNYGAASVDIAAPGVDILAAGRDGRAVHKAGTSFAVPIVSGASAILFAAHPQANARDVKDALLCGADVLDDGMVISGNVNVARSLSCLDQEPAD